MCIRDRTGKGVEDIQNGVIRTPLDPDIIFREDPLRIIRAIRFAVKYGWEITPETFEGIKRNVHRVPIVSNERIKDELDKIGKARKFHKAILLMDELGILDKVLPEMADLKGVEQDKVHHSEGDAYVHTLLVIENLEKNLDHDPDMATIWAAISHDWGKAHTQEYKDDRIHFYGHEDVSAELIEKRMRELRYPNEVIEKAKFLATHHMRGHTAHEWGPKAYRKYFYDMGDNYNDILALLEADQNASIAESGEAKNTYQLIRERMPEMTKVKIPEKPILNGNDIMSFFNLKPGPEIGVIQNIAKDLILDNPELIVEGNEVLTKQNLLNEVSKVYNV